MKDTLVEKWTLRLRLVIENGCKKNLNYDSFMNRVKLRSKRS